MSRIFKWILAVATCVTVAQTAVVHSQDKKIDAAKVLGQTLETGSLPLWSKPSPEARQDLGKAARFTERGVMLVGFPKFGHGTAWVISKQHRLLVTNAHVGDIRHHAGGKMIAIPSGTAQIYTVEKLWYHPGVRRRLRGASSLSVRSMDPEEGEVDPRSPDLAVLQLSAEGPDLTVEFPFATAEELTSLFAESAAMIGFPGHDTSWPQLGEKAAATFHDGVISRITDFEMSPSAPPAELQLLQYTMADWGGFSGSPVFLPNGHVAGVHNMAREAKDKTTGEVKMIPHGVRVDCVLELLVHHGLDDQVPFKIDKTKVAVERWTQPDARTEKARTDFAKAAQLVAEANFLIINKEEYQAGIEKCNQAIKLVPNYAPAYSTRSFGINNFAIARHANLSLAELLEQYQLALQNARKYGQLVPSDHEGQIATCSIMNNIGVEKNDHAEVRIALELFGQILGSENLSPNLRAKALSSRGRGYQFLGEEDAALRDHNEAVRLAPTVPGIWEDRGLYWELSGRGDLAAADYAKAKEMRRGALKIITVLQGGAAFKSGLRPGDIIYGVGTTRVHNLEEFTAALAKATGAVEIGFISSQNGKEESTLVIPVAGKIGVTVQSVILD